MAIYFDNSNITTGSKGEAGYTPIRGTDYWTDTDIAEIRGYVDEAASEALDSLNIDGNTTTTLNGVLVGDGEGVSSVNVLPVSMGGTEASDAETARTNIGAAPAGYGLGDTAKILSGNDDINTIFQGGWYAWSEAVPLNAPIWVNNSNRYAYMRVDSRSLNSCAQTLLSDYGNGYGISIRRQIQGGVVGEWEWINPPMAIGVEYRTTERYNGKPVYTACVNCGAAPASGYKTVDTIGLTNEAETLVGLFVFRDGGGTLYSITGSQTSYSYSGRATAYPKTEGDSRRIFIILETNHESAPVSNVRAIIRYTR